MGLAGHRSLQKSMTFFHTFWPRLLVRLSIERIHLDLSRLPFCAPLGRPFLTASLYRRWTGGQRHADVCPVAAHTRHHRMMLPRVIRQPDLWCVLYAVPRELGGTREAAAAASCADPSRPTNSSVTMVGQRVSSIEADVCAHSGASARASSATRRVGTPKSLQPSRPSGPPDEGDAASVRLCLRLELLVIICRRLSAQPRPQRSGHGARRRVRKRLWEKNCAWSRARGAST